MSMWRYDTQVLVVSARLISARTRPVCVCVYRERAHLGGWQGSP